MRRAFSSIAGGTAPPSVAISVRLRGGARSRGDAGEIRAVVGVEMENDNGVLWKVSFPSVILHTISVIFEIIQGLNKCKRDCSFYCVFV